MEFTCPNCNLLMLDDGTWGGLVAACPRCGQQFICPGEPSVPNSPRRTIQPQQIVNGIVKIPCRGNYNISVVGTSHCQPLLESFCGGRTHDSVNFACEALVTPQDDNPHDKLAVRVTINGWGVGHLSEGAARRWRSWLKRHDVPNIPALCAALIVGGWYRSPIDIGHFGVRLDLPLRDSVYD